MDGLAERVLDKELRGLCALAGKKAAKLRTSRSKDEHKQLLNEGMKALVKFSNRIGTVLREVL
jgi:hypothetical protein